MQPTTTPPQDTQPQSPPIDLAREAIQASNVQALRQVLESGVLARDETTGISRLFEVALNEGESWAIPMLAAHFGASDFIGYRTEFPINLLNNYVLGVGENMEVLDAAVDCGASLMFIDSSNSSPLDSMWRLYGVYGQWTTMHEDRCKEALGTWVSALQQGNHPPLYLECEGKQVPSRELCWLCSMDLIPDLLKAGPNPNTWLGHPEQAKARLAELNEALPDDFYRERYATHFAAATANLVDHRFLNIANGQTRLL